jgi:hypothetical protein
MKYKINYRNKILLKGGNLNEYCDEHQEKIIDSDKYDIFKVDENLNLIEKIDDKEKIKDLYLTKCKNELKGKLVDKRQDIELIKNIEKKLEEIQEKNKNIDILENNLTNFLSKFNDEKEIKSENKNNENNKKSDFVRIREYLIKEWEKRNEDQIDEDMEDYVYLKENFLKKDILYKKFYNVLSWGQGNSGPIGYNTGSGYWINVNENSDDYIDKLLKNIKKEDETKIEDMINYIKSLNNKN